MQSGESKKRKIGVNKTRILFLITMLAIPLLHFAVFYIYLNLSSFTIAFQNMQGDFTFNNFVMMWDSLTTSGGELAIALKNTLLYFGNAILIVFPLNLLVSYFFYKKIWGYKFFRIVFYLPAIISGVVMVAVYTEFIKPWGPLGVLLESVGIDIPLRGFLGQASTATATIIVYCTWTGFTGNVLLFSGAMSRVPVEVIEAARLDGCGVLREVVQLIVPLIWPTMSTMLLLSFTGLLSSGGPILLFTNGNYDTSTLSYWIFSKVYYGGSGGTGFYGLVSAMGMFFTIIMVPLILLARWLMEKIPSIEY